MANYFIPLLQQFTDYSPASSQMNLSLKSLPGCHKSIPTIINQVRAAVFMPGFSISMGPTLRILDPCPVKYVVYGYKMNKYLQQARDVQNDYINLYNIILVL